MTNASQGIAWSATDQPFGKVRVFNAPSTTMDLRFPAQWLRARDGMTALKQI
ncbi:MAG: hypothetical protein WBF43_15045 [Methylocella sp.]